MLTTYLATILAGGGVVPPGTTYLSIAEYLRRYGQAETIRVTDESKTGTVDEVKLAEAIGDQEQIIDAYLGTRYTLPLGGTHPILEGIAAALTREALHRERPTQAVTEQADRARAQLRDLAAGRAALPLTPGDTPPAQNPDGLAVRTHDGRPRVFTAGALCDYTDLGGRYGGSVFNGPCNW